MYESNEVETSNGKRNFKLYRSLRVRGAEEVSVNVISRMALFTSRTHVTVSRRSKIRMAPNVPIENLVRFWLRNNICQ